MLSFRQKSIINYLLQTKEYITIKELSNLFRLSERSIQYDLESIEYFAKKRGSRVIRNKQTGVKILPSAAFEKLLTEEQGLEMVLTPEERRETILITLFESLEPISSNQFAKELSVTRRTIVNDLKEVQTWLSSHSLKLEYITNKGFSVKGDEQKFRQSYVDVLIRHYQSNAFASYLEMLEASDIALIHRSIDSALDKEEYEIVQTAKDGLAFHIAITIHRVRNHFQINMPEKELEKLRYEREFRIAKLIQETVEEKFSLTIPEAEIGYITLHLLGAKQSNLGQEEDMGGQDLLTDTVIFFIKYVSGFMGVDLTSDPLLLRGLTVHLRPAIYRMQYQMRNENPFKNEIEERYPNIIRAVRSNLAQLENIFHVTLDDDEVAYLALHIGAAIERNFEKTRYGLRGVIMCASGVGTSQLLKSKIENYYPELQVYDSFSVYDIADDYFAQNKIDLVITTIPTPDFPVPVIKVSPFLTKDDREKLNEHLNTEREKAIESGLTTGPALNVLLDPECVQWNAEASSWEEAIRLSTKLLIAKGIVTKDYPEAIIKQLHKNGPYMVIAKGIAMPHAKPSDGVDRPGFSFVRLKYPVSFGHSKHDPVSLIICLAATDAHIHLNALRQLMMLLQDDTRIKQIKEGDRHTFLKIIDEVSQL